MAVWPTTSAESLAWPDVLVSSVEADWEPDVEIELKRDESEPGSTSALSAWGVRAIADIATPADSSDREITDVRFIIFIKILLLDYYSKAIQVDL